MFRILRSGRTLQDLPAQPFKKSSRLIGFGSSACRRENAGNRLVGAAALRHVSPTPDDAFRIEHKDGVRDRNRGQCGVLDFFGEAVGFPRLQAPRGVANPS